MKLFYSKTSPYSRKVRMLIHVKEHDKQIEEISINPHEQQSELKLINPLGKIPALVLDNNEVLFDSPVICHYLDSLLSSPQLIPDKGWEKWQILRWEALADGLIDACYNIVMEHKRPSSEQSATSISHWVTEISQVLAEIEKKFDSFKQSNKQITLAHLSIGAAIGYVDFRLSELLYESSCIQVTAYPKIMNWYESFKTESFMQATSPI